MTKKRKPKQNKVEEMNLKTAETNLQTAKQNSLNSKLIIAITILNLLTPLIKKIIDWIISKF